jgi:hypothetical protein
VAAPACRHRVAWSAVERLHTVVFGKYLNNLRAKLDLPRSKASTDPFSRNESTAGLVWVGCGTTWRSDWKRLGTAYTL